MMKKFTITALVLSLILMLALPVYAEQATGAADTYKTGTFRDVTPNNNGTIGLDRDANLGTNMDRNAGFRDDTIDRNGSVTGLNTPNTNTYRTNAMNNNPNWGWIGLFGLIGLAGLFNRNREPQS